MSTLALTPEEQRRQEIRDTVFETLFLLGIDTSTPKAIQEFRQDLTYVREWRESVEEVKRKGILTTVSFLVVGLLGYLAATLTGHFQ